MPLVRPVTGEMIRAAAEDLWGIRDQLRGLHGDPLMFPFYPYGQGEVRAQQAYLAKFPYLLLTLFPALKEVAQTLEGLQIGRGKQG